MSELCIPKCELPFLKKKKKCELPNKYNRNFKEQIPTMPMSLVEMAIPLPRLWVKSKLYESILVNNQVTKKKNQAKYCKDPRSVVGQEK